MVNNEMNQKLITQCFGAKAKHTIEKPCFEMNRKKCS